MQIPDDKVLTSFLITCFTGIFEGLIKPLENGAQTQNMHKYKHVEGDLTYLETTTGHLFRYHTDVRVFIPAPEGKRLEIWGMNVVADVSQETLRRYKLPAFDVRDFLYHARSRGFVLTRSNLEQGRKFSLFDIPPCERAGPARDSKFFYEETIDDDLDFFGGAEEIKYRPDARSGSSLVYKAFFQGGRL